MAQHEQRDLPGHPALAVVVVVELVEHDAAARRCVSPPRSAMFASTSVVQQIIGAPRLMLASPVSMPTRSAPSSSHSAKNFSQTSALTGARVERALARAQRAEVQRERDERLARAGGRREHDVAAGEQLEDRLLLLRVGREALLGDPAQEAVEDRRGVGPRPTSRRDSRSCRVVERGKLGQRQRAQLGIDAEVIARPDAVLLESHTTRQCVIWPIPSRRGKPANT